MSVRFSSGLSRRCSSGLAATTIDIDVVCDLSKRAETLTGEEFSAMERMPWPWRETGDIRGSVLLQKTTASPVSATCEIAHAPLHQQEQKCKRWRGSNKQHPISKKNIGQQSSSNSCYRQRAETALSYNIIYIVLLLSIVNR